MHYYSLQNSGCPVERHELLDSEWIDLGLIKDEWQRLDFDWHEKTRGMERKTIRGALWQMTSKI